MAQAPPRRHRRHLTAAIIRPAWHGEIHTRPGLAVLITGALIYAAGSIMVARPYVSRPATLFIAVPLAAVAGMLALGVLALAVTLRLVVLEGGDFGIDFNLGDNGRDRRRRQ